MNMTMNPWKSGLTKQVIIIAMIVALIGGLLSVGAAKQAAAALPDGLYEINYTVYTAGTTTPSSYMNSTSFAVKPAVLSVSGGQHTVKVTLKNKDWIKSFKYKQNGTYVNAVATVSGNDVTYSFPVSNLSARVPVQVRVVVPAEIAGQPYDHTYEVDYQFDEATIE